MAAQERPLDQSAWPAFSPDLRNQRGAGRNEGLYRALGAERINQTLISTAAEGECRPVEPSSPEALSKDSWSP